MIKPLRSFRHRWEHVIPAQKKLRISFQQNYFELFFDRFFAGFAFGFAALFAGRFFSARRSLSAIS